MDIQTPERLTLILSTPHRTPEKEGQAWLQAFQKATEGLSHEEITNLVSKYLDTRRRRLQRPPSRAVDRSRRRG